MKVKDIVPGGFYHGGKVGIREVVSVGASLTQHTGVTYKVISAKARREDGNEYGDETIFTCELYSFAAWAKTHLGLIQCQDLLLELDARKLKLSPGEKAFRASLVTLSLLHSTKHDMARSLGSTPEPEILSPQIQPGQEDVQVDHLGAALERVVPV